MENPVLVWAIAAFVAMGATSMIIQAIASVGMYRAVRNLRAQVTPLIPRAEETLDAARDVLRSARTQLIEVEAVVTDASSRARKQLERTEVVVEDTVTRVHETVSALQGTVMRPIREVNGLAAGVKAGVKTLFKGGRPNVDRATQDEEMFI
jgi:hypothetical protein